MTMERYAGALQIVGDVDVIQYSTIKVTRSGVDPHGRQPSRNNALWRSMDAFQCHLIGSSGLRLTGSCTVCTCTSQELALVRVAYDLSPIKDGVRVDGDRSCRNAPHGEKSQESSPRSSMKKYSILLYLPFPVQHYNRSVIRLPFRVCFLYSIIEYGVVASVRRSSLSSMFRCTVSAGQVLRGAMLVLLGWRGTVDEPPSFASFVRNTDTSMCSRLLCIILRHDLSRAARSISNHHHALHSPRHVQSRHDKQIQ